MRAWSGPSLVAGPSWSNGRRLPASAPHRTGRQEAASVQPAGAAQIEGFAVIGCEPESK